MAPRKLKIQRPALNTITEERAEPTNNPFHSALPDREGVDAYFSALQAAAALVAATQAADVAARHVGIAEEAVGYWVGMLEMYGNVEGEGEGKDAGTGEGKQGKRNGKGKGKEKAERVTMVKGKGKSKVENEKKDNKKDTNVQKKTNNTGALNDKATNSNNTINDKDKVTDKATNNNENSTTNDPKDAAEDNKAKHKKERKIVIARIAETKAYLANISRCYKIALADEERAEKQWNETTKTAAQFPHPIIISEE